MEQFPEQEFIYTSVNPPAEPSTSAEPAKTAEPSTSPTATTPSVWGTQPPLDPTLLDIQAIAVLTRTSFGTDDLTLLIPRVRVRTCDPLSPTIHFHTDRLLMP